MRMMSGLLLALALALPSAALADEGDDEDGGGRPAEQTLPETAAQIAHDNAFGQQGARMREAHQAARAAAVAAAREAAAEAVHGRPESPGQSAGHAQGPAAESAEGRARAAAAAEAGRARAAAARAAHSPPPNDHRP